jgi:hypothetical protein
MPEHILIWQNGHSGAPSGAGALLGWRRFARSSGDKCYYQYDRGDAQINELASLSISQAIDYGRHLTIAWSSALSQHPAVTPADEIEELAFQLKPAVIVCPARPGKADRWVISQFGSPEQLPRTAVQSAINDMIDRLYPKWVPKGPAWNATALLLRPDLDAESLGLIEPEPLTSNGIIAMVADDPEVKEANRREDPALPETVYALAVARLAAQERRGVPASQRAVIYVSHIEDMLAVPLSRVDFDAQVTLALLRRQLSLRYGGLTDFVLGTIFRDYPHDNHPNFKRLREAARETAATAA